MYDLMIIGGGPAGLAAGVYAARKQLSTLVNVLRKNWDVNDFCPRWGSNVDSVTSTDLLSPGGDIISGGRIMFTCSKELTVTLL